MWTSWTAALAGLLGLCAVMAGLWLVQRRTGNAGIVDAGWTYGVGGLSVLAALAGGGWAGRRAAVAVAVAGWSLRLGTYLLRDRVIGKPEDGRYTALRREWGPGAQTRLFWFFQAQALAALFFALPAFLVSANPHPDFSPLELAAMALWLAAFAGEVTADRQLAGFKQNPANKGRTCQVGVWRLSRHPNYFFEWLLWVALALYAAASPWGALAVACPAAMLYLLFRVTGIPATEAQALRSRGEEYRRYQQTTNAFFPWVPRS